MSSDPMAARLAMLRRVGGDRLVLDLIDLLLETAPRRLETMHQGLAAGDREALGRAAHSLTSSAGNLGCVELQALAAEAAEAASGGTTEALGELARRLDEAWQRARDRLEAERRAIQP
jgi:HPt (histidine-containing phosphotransfer) domain-containing protein